MRLIKKIKKIYLIITSLIFMNLNINYNNNNRYNQEYE